MLLFRQIYRPRLHNWWNYISRQIILAYLCYQRDHWLIAIRRRIPPWLIFCTFVKNCKKNKKYTNSSTLRQTGYYFQTNIMLGPYENNLLFIMRSIQNYVGRRRMPRPFEKNQQWFTGSPPHHGTRLLVGVLNSHLESSVVCNSTFAIQIIFTQSQLL